MDAYDRCTPQKNLADSVAIYGRGRELFRPPTYIDFHRFSSYFSIYFLEQVGLPYQKMSNGRVG